MGEQKLEWLRLGVNERSSAAAEKGDKGMALKIRTRAEDMPDGNETSGVSCPGRNKLYVEFELVFFDEFPVLFNGL